MNEKILMKKLVLNKIIVLISVMVFMIGMMSGSVLGAISDITVISPDGGEYWAGTQDVTWTATCSDGDYVDVSWKTGAGWTVIVSGIACTDDPYSWDTTTVSDNTNYQIKVEDMSTPGMNDVSDAVFTVDNTDPEEATDVTSSSHTVSTWSNDNTVVVTWTDATDATSGLDGYSIVWDTTSNTLPVTTKNIEEGIQTDTSHALSDGNSHYFHIRSVDNAGNWDDTAVHLGPFFIDTTDPTITDDYDDDNVWVNSVPQTVKLSPADTGGSGLVDDPNGVKYCVGGGCNPSAGTGLSSSYELSYDTEQETTVRYQAYDNAGNPSAVGEYIVKIDLIDPAVLGTTLTSPNGGQLFKGGSSQPITWNDGEITDDNLGSNPINLEYCYDEGSCHLIASNEANDGTYDWTVPEIDSTTVKVKITAADLAGNSASDESDAVFEIDSTDPSIVDYTLQVAPNLETTEDNVVFSPNGDGIEDSVDIDLEFSEHVGWSIEIWDESGPVHSWTGSSTDPNSRTWDGTGNTGDKIYTINVTATDDAGNQIIDESKTITLDTTIIYAGGGSNYATIQAAIDAANPGDTINVAAGTYNEDVLIDKSLTLKSVDGKASTIINGQSTGYTGAVKVAASNVIIGGTSHGFTINGAGQAAIYLNSGTSNVEVEDNIVNAASGKNAFLTEGGVSDHTISGNLFGGDGSQLVYVNGQASVSVPSINVDFIGNTFAGTATGPALGQEATDSEISGNTFTTTTGYTRLELWGSNNVVSGNTFDGALSGTQLLDNTETLNMEDVLANNIFDRAVVIDRPGNSLLYTIWSNIQDAVDNAQSSDTIQVADGTYNEDVTIDTPLMLQSETQHAAVIDGGILINTDTGIVTIDGFVIENGAELYGPGSIGGVTIVGSNHVIKNNIFIGDESSCLYPAIHHSSGNNLVIEYNEMYDWCQGIYLNPSSGHVIENNNLHDNAVGIGSDGLSDVTIQFNDFIDNDVEVWSEGFGSSNVGVNVNVNYNTFVGNSTGVNHYGGNNINAINNWWGDITGPYHVTTNADGLGDEVSDNVDYRPWAYNSNVDTDEIKPTTTINSPAESSWYKENFDVGITDSDTGGSLLAKCEYQIESGGEGSWSTTKGWTERTCSQIVTLAVGLGLDCIDQGEDMCKINARAWDNSGNTNLEMPYTTFSIDWTGPSFEWIVPDGEYFTDGDEITVEADVTETGSGIENGADCNPKIDGDTTSFTGAVTYNAGLGECSGTLTLNNPSGLGDGAYELTLSLTDNVGNTGTSDENEIEIDNTPPTIEGIYHSPENPTSEDEIEIGAEIDDNGVDSGNECDDTEVILYYRVNEGEWDDVSRECTTPFEYYFESGTFSGGDVIDYYIVAEDSLGNSGQTEQFSFEVNDFFVELEEDWNLVSVPKTLVESKLASDVFGGMETWGYDAVEGAWKGLGDSITVDPGYGYWVQSGTGDDIGVNYADDCTGPNCGLPSETINLYQGWNLIGHMCTHDQRVRKAFPPDIYNNLFVLRYDEDDDVFEIYATQLPLQADFTRMTPGEGYWVFLPRGDLLYTNICNEEEP